MTTQPDRQQLRLGLLRYLATAAPRALQEGLLAAYARAEGLAATRQDIAAELAYLADKGLVHAEASLVAPEISAWRILAAGRDYLAEIRQEGA
jgi:hypothetical protein